MKFGLVNFPGAFGFADSMYALHDLLEQHVEPVWYESSTLPKVDAIILPSGASFGDEPEPALRAVATPVMKAIAKFAANGGIVVGIGNGFQILCASGLLSGRLTTNDTGSFVGRNVYVRSNNNTSPLTRLTAKGQILQVPIAHAFGNFQADEATLRDLHQHNQILLRYCNDDGSVSDLANPDGSVDNIAAICNRQMNVFGMMACIERAVDPDLGNVNGLLFFESLISE